MGSSCQRHPPVFAGLRGDDYEEWLDQYNRVSQFNRWEDTSKLGNVICYLSDVANAWYLNNEDTLNEWAFITEQLRQIFGTPSALSHGANQKLGAHWKRCGETYVSYIEDVLALCRRESPVISEADKVPHIL